VSALLHDCAFGHNNNVICILDCGKTMRNHHGCSVARNSVECCLYNALAGDI
jgi:hypothetical protein